MNNRLEQKNVAYKKALGAILLKEFPHLTDLSLSDFLIDPSGATGRVWLSTSAENLEKVKTRRSHLQRELVKRVQTRHTPKLTFLIDDNYLNSVEKLFNHLHED